MKHPIEHDIYHAVDDDCREFMIKLLPTIDKERILGLRGPKAKEIAKRYANTDTGEAFMRKAPHKYYDENLVHGYMLGFLRCDDVEKWILRFMICIDNWAVCDTMVSNLKWFFKDRKRGYELVSKLMHQTFTQYPLRAGIVSLLCYYVDDEYIDRVLEYAKSIKSQFYYVNMAVAWLVSVCLAKQYEKTIKLIEANQLDEWIHNKAIQKAIESYRITEEQKNYLRSLKRK